MADNIADLLDEVERKYCSPKATPITAVDFHGNHKTTSPLTKHLDNDAIDDDDDDLEKIFGEIVRDSPDVESKKPLKVAGRVRLVDKKNHSGTCGHSLPLEGKRCYPVLLAGTDIPMGHSDIHTRRACDQLRCTSCDFHVIIFDARAWHSASDYLFFRNSMPDPCKLRQRLVHRKGCRAYACQCSWRSVTGEEELGRDRGGEGKRGEVREGRGVKGKRRVRVGGSDALPETASSAHTLKWVCGRH